MGNYDTNITFVKKYNEDACNELYNACDSLKQMFIEGEEESIKAVKDIANTKILEINKSTSTLLAYHKKVIEEKLRDKTAVYITKMKEFRIF